MKLLHFDQPSFHILLFILVFKWKIMYNAVSKIDDEERQAVYKALDTLNTFLDGNKYLIGSEEPTLADVISFVSVTNVTVCVDSDSNTLSL